MTQHYRKGQTIFDPETGDYQKIEVVRTLTIRGVKRTFYDLGAGVGHAPEARWREHHEVLARQPTAADYEV